MKIKRKIFVFALLLCVGLSQLSVKAAENEPNLRKVSYYNDIDTESTVVYKTVSSTTHRGANPRLIRTDPGIPGLVDAVNYYYYYCRTCGAYVGGANFNSRTDYHNNADFCNGMSHTVTTTTNHNLCKMHLTVVDSDIKDGITYATVSCDLEGEDALKDVTFEWFDSEQNSLGIGNSVEISGGAGHYYVRFNKPGYTYVNNQIEFDVTEKGIYTFPVIYVGDIPIETESLAYVGIERIYIGENRIY